MLLIRITSMTLGFRAAISMPMKSAWPSLTREPKTLKHRLCAFEGQGSFGGAHELALSGLEVSRPSLEVEVPCKQFQVLAIHIV